MTKPLFNEERTYEYLITLPTFEERYEYLKLDGTVGDMTFGGYRELNQMFYKSQEWKDFRKMILQRDNFCDLALPGYDIPGYIYVHHLNPLLPEDLMYQTSKCFDPNNVVCVSYNTHQGITYGLPLGSVHQEPAIRTPNDTCPWRK